MNFISPAFQNSETNQNGGAEWAPLKTALSHMVTASEAQKDRVREFQSVTKDLKATFEKLNRTCEAFQRSLGRIRIKRLRRNSLALVKTMEGSLGPRLVSK